MARNELIGKPAAAMLHNVHGLLEAIERLRGRKDHLPGLGCMYGPSGYGKTYACATAAAIAGAVHVEAKEHWGKREFVRAVATALGIPQGRTIADTVDAIGDHMRDYQPVLLLDEADILVRKGMIEYARTFHMMSEAPVILIGEETLPRELKRYERIHNRILKGAWVPAQAASLADARQLAEMFVDACQIDDDLLALVVSAARGVIRRIVTNLEEIEQAAIAEGRSTADRAWWGNRGLDTGDAPARRP
ncbi:AAA family ATPase [Zavarzinia sp.]|uniref:AAA family ATPase n=1 Tax=Zavarzinia sp. TaxID=2027920 RepID=UPI003BB6EF2E